MDVNKCEKTGPHNKHITVKTAVRGKMCRGKCRSDLPGGSSKTPKVGHVRCITRAMGTVVATLLSIENLVVAKLV